jgi:uridine kinase
MKCITLAKYNYSEDPYQNKIPLQRIHSNDDNIIGVKGNLKLNEAAMASNPQTKVLIRNLRV